MNFRRENQLRKKIIIILMFILTIGLLVSCQQNNNKVVIPPEKNSGVILETQKPIYISDGSTSYSLGGFDSTFTLSDNLLIVMDDDQIRTFDISYEEVSLTVESFQKQFRDIKDIPDISQYDKLVQYDLCKSTNETPGYRLYVLDDQYWMGVLYGTAVYRIVSVDIAK